MESVHQMHKGFNGYNGQAEYITNVFSVLYVGDLRIVSALMCIIYK